MNAFELFKIFEKHNLKLAKKKDIDYMKEVYSQTELFDISQLCSTPIPNEYLFYLPFSSCFVTLGDSGELKDIQTYCISFHEYDQEQITGSFFEIINFEDSILEDNIPFVFNIKTKKLVFNYDIPEFANHTFDILYHITHSKYTNKKEIFAKFIMKHVIDINRPFTEIKKDIINLLPFYKFKSEAQELADSLELLIERTLKIISHNNYVIYTDKTNKPEFYSFKNKPTIKVPSRVIYYYLDKEKSSVNKIKPITKLEYCHSFKVRGHWRKLNNETLGKDRNGNYDVKGYTWVKDFTKGKGELIHKIRKIK